jgi:pimeloyl-[acyl-carrier protein] methyl ester esterase
MLALREAARHPGQVAGLFLMGATARFCSDDATHRYGTPVAQVRAMQTGLRQHPARTLAAFFRLSAAPAAPDESRVRALVDAALREDHTHLAGGLRFLRDTDLRRDALSIGVRALVLHGKEDAVVPWQAGQQLAESMPNAEWERVDRVGHDLPARCAEQVAARLRQFADGCP